MPIFARSIPSVPDRFCFEPVRAPTRHPLAAVQVEFWLLPAPIGSHRFPIPHPVRTVGERQLALALAPSDSLACPVAQPPAIKSGAGRKSRKCRKKSISPARRTRRVWPSSKTKPSPKSITSARTNTPSPVPSTTAASPASFLVCNPALWTSGWSAMPSSISRILWRKPPTQRNLIPFPPATVLAPLMPSAPTTPPGPNPMAGPTTVAAEAVAVDATAIVTVVPIAPKTPSLAPKQHPASNRVLLMPPPPLHRGPATPPRSAKVLPAPRLTAAGVAVADAVADAVPPASRVIPSSRTLLPPTRRKNPPANTIPTSKSTPPNPLRLRPPAATTASAPAMAATTSAAMGSVSTPRAATSARNAHPVASRLRATAMASTPAKPAAPAPSLTPIPTPTPARLPSRWFFPASRSPSTAKAKTRPRPVQRPRSLRSLRLRPPSPSRLRPISTPSPPAGMAETSSPARPSHGAVRPIPAPNPVAISNASRDAKSDPAARAAMIAVAAIPALNSSATPPPPSRCPPPSRDSPHLRPQRQPRK